MKTSFEFEKYRKDLADNLREKISGNGFGSARKDLEKEQEKPEYKIAKGLKLMERQVEHTHPESREAFDLIIEKYDISDKIPNSLKLYIDKARENNIYGFDDSKKFLKNIDLKKELINSLNQYNKKEIDSELEESFWGRKIEDLTEEQLANLLGLLLINKLTEGALINENNANHVVNGEGSDSSLYPVSLARGSKKNIVGETLFNINFDPHERFISKDRILFLSTTKERGRYFKSYSQIIIVNPISDRFLYLRDRPSKWEIKRGKENGEDVLEKWKEEKRKEWEKEKQFFKKSGGLRVSLEETSPKWFEIADWIVDLPGGKLYKITEGKK